MAFASLTLTRQDQTSLATLTADLRRVFAGRLQSIVAYGLDDRGADGLLHTLAFVDRLTFDDLTACAPLTRGWSKLGLDVPLLLERDEFQRTLDVFPLEYGAIMARHVVVAGDDPFRGASVSAADTRRAIELHAKSLLIHLREGFLESGADPSAVSRLIGASAPSLRALLINLATLESLPVDDLPVVAEHQIGIPAATVRDVLSAANGASGIVDPTALFARYITAAERVWEYVDAWRIR